MNILKIVFMVLACVPLFAVCYVLLSRTLDDAIRISSKTKSR